MKDQNAGLLAVDGTHTPYCTMPPLCTHIVPSLFEVPRKANQQTSDDRTYASKKKPPQYSTAPLHMPNKTANCEIEQRSPRVTNSDQQATPLLNGNTSKTATFHKVLLIPYAGVFHHVRVHLFPARSPGYDRRVGGNTAVTLSRYPSIPPSTKTPGSFSPK